jgi:hypothetical protein
VANDLEQAQGRVFEAVRKIVELCSWLKNSAKITQTQIRFPATDGTITAIASDYAGAAGANPVISCFDELWGYTSERSHRLWDEMVPPPTRKIACRLTTTYAGFESESQLLEGLRKRGLSQPQIGPDLYAGGGQLTFWTHTPVAPWQDDAWLAQMRQQLRPNAYLRMIENRFVSTDTSFIDMDWWDQCVDPQARPLLMDRALPVWLGVDASVRRDSTAVVCCPTECRAALAQAITARDKAEQAVSKLRTASAQANRNADAASKRLEAARAAADKARAEHIERAEQAAKEGKPLPSSSSWRGAEVADATEAVEAARAAGAKITERVSDLEGELRRVQDRVAAAADDVIRATSVAQLVTQARALQDDVGSRRLALLYLLGENLVGDESERKLVADLLHDAALPEVVSVNGRVIESTHADHPDDRAEAWRQARAALARDAEAVLPV